MTIQLPCCFSQPVGSFQRESLCTNYDANEFNQIVKLLGAHVCTCQMLVIIWMRSSSQPWLLMKFYHRGDFICPVDAAHLEGVMLPLSKVALHLMPCSCSPRTSLHQSTCIAASAVLVVRVMPLA